MFDTRDTDRLGLYFVGGLCLLAVAMCLSALFGGVRRGAAPAVAPQEARMQ